MQIGRARLFHRSVIADKAKALVYAVALTGFASAAQADGIDLGSLKEAPTIPTSVAGVTVYGAIDAGYVFQTHGAPVSGALPTGVLYNMFGSSTARKEISTFGDSGLSQSFIGLKVEESVIPGWTVIGRAEMGFQPLSGELADGCASLSRMNGLSQVLQISKGDSSRCGQILNGQVYAGVSNSTYGTLTIGRQNSLDLDLMAAYDPMALSYAFSLLGYSGTPGGGVGDTEDSRWDNSIKYIYQYGPVHASGMYAVGSFDSSIQDSAASGGAGFTWQGFSADFIYTKENGAVSSASLSAAQCLGLGFATIIPAPGLTASPGCAGAKVLQGTISDDTAWTVGVKYTFDFSGGGGLKDGGLKDGNCCCTGSPDDPWWCGKLTLYAGYQNAEINNPTDPVIPGATTIGGYVLAVTLNENFITSKVFQTVWAGAKYELPSNWTITGAYYHLEQNSWITTATPPGGAAGAHSCLEVTGFNATNKAAGKFFGNTTGSNCAGDIDMGAFVVDYAFNKYFDVYTGVNYSTASGGLSSGFFVDNMFLYMTGIRLRF